MSRTLSRIPSIVRIDLALVTLFMVATLSACAIWTPDPASFVEGYSEKGYASWYGPGFHGKRAANGEIYDQNKLTAAHKFIPFGSLVEVTRRDTGAKVVVRITDRGPFVRGRNIDLSRAAAKRLDAIGPGVVPVRLRIVATPAQAAAKMGKAYTVQLGKFRNLASAEALRTNLEPRIPGLRLQPADPPGTVRVVTRRYTDYGYAKKIAHRISRDLAPGAFVVEEVGP